ncbi:MAG: Ig-like domain-containing protein, partial [Spirochaetota bacterium]
MKMKATERAVAALALIALMAGCSVFGALIPVSGLSLNKSADTIAVGSSDNLRVTISPSFAADPGLSWTSSEPSVASVSSGGLVTGKASGSSTVTVSAPGGGIKASCVVTVVPVVYAVGSMSGNLYEINVTSGMASLSSLVSTGKNASGEVLYAGGKGFIAVASDGTGNNIPGLYTFDPSKPALGCALVGTSISAQFLWISSATTGYVTSALYGSTDPGSDAVWSFNPSLPNAGITKIANLSYPQEVIQGSDGKVYIAELNKKTVARLNAVSGAIEAEIPCVSYGTTGLLSGEFNGNQGVFVANTGYDSSYTY